MRLNDDLSKPVIIHAGRMDWVPSPAAGVDRRMLFRIGGEVARATSIVRYAPGSAFPRHAHGGGEEILVLEGVFQDEHGDYPAGCYFRNPPGTSHVPASKEGCTIFVRLWQFREGDAAQVVRQPGAEPTTVLFDDGHEAVRLQHWAAGAAVDADNPRGLEFLVLSGGLTVGSERLERQAWGRLPVGTRLRGVAGPAGARLWLRDAPLLHSDVLAMP
ncbi:cupin domain-containing protein [Dankookia sp. P2]|uniref:cupin domain-containing protein n=1 Tax=Dankookia sp. P2 TaxID=3423955 RepID=UPI003D66547C